jgi:hypothetical protein
MDTVELKAQEYGIKVYKVVEYKTLKLKEDRGVQLMSSWA